MVRSCPVCGGTDIEEDAARGDTTCTGCGTVLEESVIVAENQFQERAGGSGHTLVGQFVSADRQSAAVHGVGVSQESREITFQKGRRLIEEIASQLRINQFCIDTAYNFFKMCVTRNLTRGRVRSHVVAACMYMTCRIESTPHLLLDFSDVTQVNVFDLGRTLSFLARSLKINIPATDPCLYVIRFACLLEFGDHQKEVVNLAARLVERMKKDWISTGRRPTGLCGAALLIAARAYNFNRSIADVVRVVHISETVVRKRLEEFSQTPSGALTIDEFQVVDLDQSEDPPAFREARKKDQQEKLKEEQLVAEKMTDEVHQMEVEVEKALEKKRREKFKHTPYAKELTGVDRIEEDVGRMEAAFVSAEIMQSVYDVADGAEQGPSNSFSQYGPTLQSLGIGKVEPTDHFMDDSPPLPMADNDNGDLNLEDIDDDEIDSYILSNAESEVKEKFWMKVNGEHLKEMERRKREREEAEAKEPDPNKKKRKPPKNGVRWSSQENGLPPSTAAEAIEKVIQEKKLSNKVNYDILKEIDHAMPGETEDPIIRPVPTFAPSGLIKRERMMARKNVRGADVARLNLLREALNVEEKDEDTREEPKEEAVEDFKPKLLRRGNIRLRGIVKIAVKKEEAADSATIVNLPTKNVIGDNVKPLIRKETQVNDVVMTSPRRNVSPTKDKKQLIQEDKQGPPVIELEVEKAQSTMCQDEATSSNAVNQDTLEVVKVVKPPGRLQRGKRAVPILKVKTEKKDGSESTASMDTATPELIIEAEKNISTPDIIVEEPMDTSNPDVIILPKPPAVEEEQPKKDAPKRLGRRIQVKPIIIKK